MRKHFGEANVLRCHAIGVLINMAALISYQQLIKTPPKQIEIPPSSFFIILLFG